MTEEQSDLFIKVGVLILGFLFWWWVLSLIFPQKPVEELTKPYRANLATISQNTLIGTVNPVYIKPIVYASIIDCLEFYESSGNPNALGKAGERGCLQFMPTTWDLYCSGDPWDCNDAKKCADEMIQNGLLSSWTTAPFCDKMN